MLFSSVVFLYIFCHSHDIIHIENIIDRTRKSCYNYDNYRYKMSKKRSKNGQKSAKKEQKK